MIMVVPALDTHLLMLNNFFCHFGAGMGEVHINFLEQEPD